MASSSHSVSKSITFQVKIHFIDQTHLKLFLEYLAMLTLKIVVNVIVAMFLLMFIFGLLNSDPSRNPNQRDLE